MKRIIPVLLGATLSGTPLPPSKALDHLFKTYWEHTLRSRPELATLVGDLRYNDRLSDMSLGAIRRDLAWQRAFQMKLKAVPGQGLGPDELLSRDVLNTLIQDRLDGAGFRPWETPLSQMDGLHIDFPQLLSSHPFRTAKDYRDYVSRLRAFPKAMDDAIQNMRSGLSHHNVPPRLVIQEVISQVRPFSGGTTATAPFLEPLGKFPAGISTAEQAALRKDVDNALKSAVTPAYGRLLHFLEKDYLPAGRVEPGLWALKDGEARYRYAIRHHTTTSLDAKAIHEIGLREVARIETEMAAIGASLGFKDLASFKEAAAKKQDLHPKDGAELVARYQSYVDGMAAELPKLFGRLPKAPLVVIPMEAFRAEGAAAADYNAGTPDGKRPGRFSVNTFKAETRTMLTCESTAYHEAIPGHHMQIAIAQELDTVPEFQKHAPFTAFEEGWALYSERLPKELGFYKDPYSDFGRLSDEMLRAIRLVLDTGVHALHWTRAQMVDFFRAHGTNDDVELQSETDRYIAWPGQALSYKLGQMRILELREKAKQKLGARFDIKGFHDCVLGGGALPLDLLERRVDAWISEREGMK
ncbi:MAG: DUF885 domain-containing protein [Acidobacteriota bacterium]|nr:DUF885 domain-containing protein [Acidobacteriota bacterium]